MNDLEQLTAGELAAESGVNLQTVRFYERRGLLPRPPRTASGYRVFSRESVRRVRSIKRARGLGFTLAPIKELLALRLDPGARCTDVRRRAEAKLNDVDRKVGDLRRIGAALAKLIAACPRRGAAGDCSILEGLEGDDCAMPSARTPPRNRRRSE